MGGSDQWGNIVAGRRARPAHRRAQLFGLTTPLVTTALGRQDGQDARRAPSGSTPSALSPYDYWQFWRNTEDADVGRFLRLFTELPLAEIARLEQLRRRRDQRGEEGAGDRGDGAVPRPRGGRGGGGDGARGVRGGRRRRGAAAGARVPRDALGARAFRPSSCSSAPGLRPRTARRAALIKGGGARVNDVVDRGETQPVSLCRSRRRTG